MCIEVNTDKLLKTALAYDWEGPDYDDNNLEMVRTPLSPVDVFHSTLMSALS